MKNKIFILIAAITVLASVAVAFTYSAYSAERSSSSYGIESDALTGGGVTSESTNYKLENSSIGEPVAPASMEGASYGIFSNYQETLGTDPDAPTALMQYLANGTTMIGTGEWTSSDTIVFKFTVSDPDPSNFIVPQVELRATADAFTGNPNYSGIETSYSGTPMTMIVTADGISNNTKYHWRARVIDDEYRTSPWVSFGNNADGVKDFGVLLLASPIYVSPTGNDETGTGSLAAPFRTIQQGLDFVSAGGTVYMLSGVYTLEAGSFVNSSMVNWPNRNNITLKLSPEATTPATIDAVSQGRLITVPNSVNMTIEGITLQGGYLGMYSGLSGGAMLMPSDSNLWLTNVLCQNNTKEGGGGGGAVWSPDSSTNIYIDGSTFKNNRVWSDWNGGAFYSGNIFASNSKFIANSGMGAVHNSGNMTATNCVFAYNGGSEIFRGGTNTMNNSVFYGNSISYFVNYGTWVSNNSIYWGNTAVVFWGNLGALTINYSDIQPNAVFSYVSGTGSISIEPRFMSTNETSADFLKLAAGSPCIDAASRDATSTDLAGNARPHGFGPDMGAYEFQGPSVRVVLPNGGEAYFLDQPLTVTWTISDEGGLRSSPGPIYVRYSTNEGSSWTTITSEAANTGIITFEPLTIKATQYLVSVEAVNAALLWNYDVSNNTFAVYGVLYPPTNVTAEALPNSSPTMVKLYWLPSTSDAFDGYNVYSGSASGSYSPTKINSALVTFEEYSDGTVSLGTDYFYAIRSFGFGSASPYSNDASAPLMKMSRLSTTESPIGGGYSGSAHDPVPGATIRYTLNYRNTGFAPAKSIIIVDKVPPYTDYKIGSATGEAVISVRYSNDSGSSYGYEPVGAIVDPTVTNISWEVIDASSGASKVCTFEVVIR